MPNRRSESPPAIELQIYMGKALIIILMISLFISATAATEGENEIPIFEVEVVEQKAPISIGTNPISFSSISETEIERSGVQNLMDLLVREPGVWVSRQGNAGFGGNVSIRGFGGSPPTQVAVMLDGHPSQMGIMGHILPTSYILDNVKRIEILRGPSGIVHGDMAIGGAINIVSRGPYCESSNHTLSITGGAFDTIGSQFSFRGANERFGYRAQVGRFYTDGDNPFARYDANNYSLAFDAAFGGGWDIAFRGQRLTYATFDQREVANAFEEGREANFIGQDYDRVDYDLEFSRRNDDRETSVKVYRTQGEHKFEDNFHSKDFGEGIFWSQTAPLGRGKGQWGLTFRRFGGEVFSPAPIAGTFSRTENAAFFVAEQPINDKTEYAAGFRYTDPREFSSKFLPYIGLNHELNDDWSLFASARRGYRLPSFRELYLFGINNPNLKPEIAWQYEIGARRSLPSGGRLEIAAFGIKADDLIVLGPRPEEIPGTPVQLANAGNVTRYGFEAGARWPVNLSTEMYANFSLLDPGNIKQKTVGRKFAVGVDREIGDWMLSSDLQYVDRLFDFDQTNALVRVPSFMVVNMKAERPLSRGTKLGLVVRNVFNESYRIDPAYPYPMQGRYIGLQVETSR